jgi:hypothetical protein
MSSNYWRGRADQSDDNARRLGIDPPSPDRKTYTERYNETMAMSKEDRDALLAQREADHEECGVIYRVKADLGE